MKLLFRNNNVLFGAITISDKTSSAFKATGAFTDFKGLVSAKGFSFKADSATEWTDSAVSSTTYAKTFSDLSAETKYNVRMYVTVNGAKQYSAPLDVTTEAAPAPESGPSEE